MTWSQASSKPDLGASDLGRVNRRQGEHTVCKHTTETNIVETNVVGAKPVYTDTIDRDVIDREQRERHSLSNAALGLLARREYSRGELREKLARRSNNADLIDQILDDLIQQGLQSDERFSELFVRYKVGQGKGPMRIRQDLRQKHIPDALIENYVSDDAEFWLQQAQLVYQRKYSDSPIQDDKDKAKRLRFMVSRGFPAHQVFDLIQ